MKYLKTFENYSNSDVNEEIDFKALGQKAVALGQKIGITKDPVKKRAIALDAIQRHPNKSKKYLMYLKEDPKKAEKYVDIHVKYAYEKGDILYIGWSKEKNDFEKNSIETDATGLLGTKKY